MQLFDWIWLMRFEWDPDKFQEYILQEKQIKKKELRWF